MQEHDSHEEPLSKLEPAESDTVDIAGKTLLELLNEPESDIAASVRQLLAQRAFRQDAVSSWSSFLR